MVDASVAPKRVFDEADSAWARSLLVRETRLCAPGLIWTGCASAFWRIARATGPSLAAGGSPLGTIADVGFAVLRRAPIHILETGVDVHELAVRIGATLDHPIHDCLHLAVALRGDAALATADTRFLRALRGADALPPDRLLTPPPAG